MRTEARGAAAMTALQADQAAGGEGRHQPEKDLEILLGHAAESRRKR